MKLYLHLACVKSAKSSNLSQDFCLRLRLLIGKLDSVEDTYRMETEVNMFLYQASVYNYKVAKLIVKSASHKILSRGFISFVSEHPY